MSEFNPITTILALGMLIFAAKLFAIIFRRMNLPEVVGEICAGLIFGPYAIGGLISFGGEHIFNGPIEYNPVFETLFEIGGMIILFTAGLEFTFTKFRKAGAPAFVIGTAGVVFPFILGYYGSLYAGFESMQAMLIGAALTATSIAITIRTLEELNQLKNEESEVMVYAAVVDDVLGLAVLGVVLAIGRTGIIPSLNNIISTTVITLFIWMALLIGSVYVLPKFLDIVNSKITVPGTIETLTIVIILIWGVFAYSLGLSPIVGTFAAGMAIAGSQFKHRIEEFTSKISIFFAPIFFAYVGAQINIAEIIGIDLFAFGVILVLAMLGKIVGCGIPALIFFKDKLKAQRIGIGMASRGEVGIVIAGVGYAVGMIDSQAYAILMAVIISSTITSPIILRRLARDEHSDKKKINI